MSLRAAFLDYFSEASQSSASEDSNSGCQSATETPNLSRCNTPTSYNQSFSIRQGTATVFTCKWHRCKFSTEIKESLYMHTTHSHVESQKEDSAVCLWENCKIYDDTPEKDRKWLDKHMKGHTGEKPHKCVLAGCEFSCHSKDVLLKHVQIHFDGKPMKTVNKQPSNLSMIQKRQPTDSPLARSKHRRVMKYPPQRRIITPKFGELDTAMVSKLQTELCNLRTQVDLDPEGHPGSIGVKGRVIATRTRSGTDKTELCIHWEPEGIIPNEWIDSHKVETLFKTISLSKIPKTLWTGKVHPLLSGITKKKHTRKNQKDK